MAEKLPVKFYLVPGVRNRKIYLVPNDSYETIYLAVKELISISDRAGRGGKRPEPSIEIRVCILGNICIFHFAKICILGQSTVLCFLVVKTVIAANDDQLRISIIILQTSHFFLQKLVKFQLYLGTGGWPQC